jgi:hypothetical protein
MITLFENFNNDIKLKDYIIQQNDIYCIPKLSFDKLGEWYIQNLNKDYYTPIKYNSLMRFYLYMKLLRYNGGNPVILKYIDGLKNKDKEKIEIINKIPNNKIVMSLINKKFNFGFPNNYNFDDLQELKKLISKIGEVLSDKNLEEYIASVSMVSEKAKISEKVVKGVIAMIYGRYYDITKAELSDDLGGVDIWMINKETGGKQSIQVKNITGNVTFKIVDDKIYINNSKLDLHKFSTSDERKLPYDYLGFYLEYQKQVCIVKANAIFTIDNPTENTIIIKLKNWAMEEKFYKFALKLVDIPPKLLPKDFSKIFIDNEKAPARLKKKIQ